MTVPADIGWNEPFFIARLKFVTTCPSTPEQYDVFSGEEKVGYVRVRFGCITAQSPDWRGELVLDAWPKGNDYLEPDEREYWLTEAAVEIRTWMKINGKRNNA